MGKPTGFLDYAREENPAIEPLVRIENFNESCLRGFLPIIGFCLVLVNRMALHDCVLVLE